MKTPESGFIAIISVIIIAAILMAVSLSLSTSGFFARANVADSEYKEQSMALAQACIQDARVKIAADPHYSGNETLLIGTNPCTIQAVTISGTQKIVQVTATFQSAVTTLAITIDGKTLSLISLQELP